MELLIAAATTKDFCPLPSDFFLDKESEIRNHSSLSDSMSEVWWPICDLLDKDEPIVDLNVNVHKITNEFVNFDLTEADSRTTSIVVKDFFDRAFSLIFAGERDVKAEAQVKSHMAEIVEKDKEEKEIVTEDVNKSSEKTVIGFIGIEPIVDEDTDTNTSSADNPENSKEALTTVNEVSSK